MGTNLYLTTGDAQLVADSIFILAILSVLLIIAVIAFKVSRDRNEHESSVLQVRILDAWQGGSEIAMREVALDIREGGVRAQSDLAAVCNRTAQEPWWTPERIAQVRQSFIDSGLATQLERQFQSGNTLRRGLAVFIAGFPCWSVNPAVIEAFTQDKEPTIRLAAVAALERLATADAARALIHALEANHLPRARIMERLGHEWAVQPMLEALAKPGQTWEVRCDLLRGLSLAGDARAVEAALEACGSEEKFERLQAMRVLARTYAKATPEQQHRIEQAALRGTADDYANVRSQSVEVLQQIPHSLEFDTLQRLVGDNDWFVRRAAARALVVMGDEGRRRLDHIANGGDRFASQRAREELAMFAAFPDYQPAGA